MKFSINTNEKQRINLKRLVSLGAYPVSYTHLDVYKRQAVCRQLFDSV